MTNSSEITLINAICKNKDLSALMTNNLEELVDGNADVIASMKDYYAKYRSLPGIETLRERFPHLEKIDTDADASYYLDNLREHKVGQEIKRLSLLATQKLKEDSSLRVLEGFQANLSRLNRFSGQSRDLDAMDFDAAEAHYEHVREKAALMGGVPGIPTGVDFIDAGYPTGLAGGDLVVVLGWTGRGKSLLTTLIAVNAYLQGKKAMIISLEMSPEKVRDRIYTILGSGLFKNSELANGAIDVDDFRSFSKKHSGRDGIVIVANDGTQEITPNFVQAKIDEHRPDVVILDYAQLTSDNNQTQDMTARMRNMSKEYKRSSMANDIPTVLISSATPDSTAALSSPPLVEQVAWSKQLSYDADLAIAVHKHDGTNLIEVVCRKNRNGELFAGFIDWDINSGLWRISYNEEGL